MSFEKRGAGGGGYSTVFQQLCRGLRVETSYIMQSVVEKSKVPRIDSSRDNSCGNALCQLFSVTLETQKSHLHGWNQERWNLKLSNDPDVLQVTIYTGSLRLSVFFSFRMARMQMVCNLKTPVEKRGAGGGVIAQCFNNCVGGCG